MMMMMMMTDLGTVMGGNEEGREKQDKAFISSILSFLPSLLRIY